MTSITYTTITMNMINQSGVPFSQCVKMYPLYSLTESLYVKSYFSTPPLSFCQSKLSTG
jgi:hypothetical protein